MIPRRRRLRRILLLNFCSRELCDTARAPAEKKANGYDCPADSSKLGIAELSLSLSLPLRACVRASARNSRLFGRFFILIRAGREFLFEV